MATLLMAVASYRDYEREAHQLVRQLLESSLERVLREQRHSQEKAWPLGADFTVEKGLETIATLVKGWCVSESWEHCTDFLAEENKLFSYRVRWSEPTRCKPVPSATASVYFYILVQELKSPVIILYVMEGQRLVHRYNAAGLIELEVLVTFSKMVTALLEYTILSPLSPESTTFQEVWLRNVIDNKLAVSQTVRVN